MRISEDLEAWRVKRVSLGRHPIRVSLYAAFSQMLQGNDDLWHFYDSRCLSNSICTLLLFEIALLHDLFIQRKFS